MIVGVAKEKLAVLLRHLLRLGFGGQSPPPLKLRRSKKATEAKVGRSE